MRINNNIMALNAQRQLVANQTGAAKSIEKLSSGLRINRAGDDAAGLAISEKMRAQIRGLRQAVRNAQDGISLIQTAEGALNETHSILQRMRELATQSSSDTNTATDRAEIQKEIDQLAQELARIGNTTEFNTKKLLNGTFSGIFHIGANEAQNISLSINDMRGYALGVVSDVTYGVTATVTDTSTNGIVGLTSGTAEFEVTFNASTSKYEMVNSVGLVVASSTDGKAWTSSDSDDSWTFADAVTSGTITIDATNKTASGTARVANGNGTIGVEAGVYSYDVTAKTLTDSSGKVVATSTDDKTFKDAAGNTLFTLGAAVTADTTFTVAGINVSSQTEADRAITVINTAIEKVSTERSKLGAYQNRLEHTINNLGTSAENLQAAESRIRDVDMAEEMMTFTKFQILQQASTAMLAQANLAPQSVLQLLG